MKNNLIMINKIQSTNKLYQLLLKGNKFSQLFN